jgi:hypothetical protein
MSQPTATTSSITAIHTNIISPTRDSPVGDRSTTFVGHVEDQQLAATSHVRLTTLVTASHTTHTSPTFDNDVGDSSPTSTIHVGDMLLSSASHAGSMSPTTSNHVGGIHMIKKPRHIRRKPKFLSRLCKGYHFTRLCPTNVVVQQEWSLRGVLWVMIHL